MLEPSGRHWAIVLTPEELGQDFKKPEEVGIADLHGYQLPTYRAVTYHGHQFLDGLGNCYWIYVRVRE